MRGFKKWYKCRKAPALVTGRSQELERESSPKKAEKLISNKKWHLVSVMYLGITGWMSSKFRNRCFAQKGWGSDIAHWTVTCFSDEFGNTKFYERKKALVTGCSSDILLRVYYSSRDWVIWMASSGCASNCCTVRSLGISCIECHLCLVSGSSTYLNWRSWKLFLHK